ncbi:MAG: Rrf2 family transcriptional regulator [Bacteroidetes bacterium]|nr:Rrf2 family transcriptional regulator [Bacteroidota bacterium]
MLSKACQYAIKALIYLSSELKQGNPRVNLKAIASAIDSPPAFTSKILQQLVAAQIITSVKGGGGGFDITPAKIKSTKVITIIKAIGDDHLVTSCFLGLPHCSDANPCPVHHAYAPIREQLGMELLNISLYDIISDPKLKKYHLKP